MLTCAIRLKADCALAVCVSVTSVVVPVGVICGAGGVTGGVTDRVGGVVLGTLGVLFAGTGAKSVVGGAVVPMGLFDTSLFACSEWLETTEGLQFVGPPLGPCG